jgi:transcriptional regulator with XRE-family HTH domain
MTQRPLIGLEQRREFYNLTQAEAAKIIGCTQSSYNKIEKGQTRLDLHRGQQLAQALDCTMEELL